MLKRRQHSERPATVFDRCAVAVGAGLLTFALGGLVLLLPYPFGFGVASKGAFYFLLVASAAFAVLGFALRINFVADVLAKLANAVVVWWR
jgi:hypothetical protein